MARQLGLIRWEGMSLNVEEGDMEGKMVRISNFSSGTVRRVTGNCLFIYNGDDTTSYLEMTPVNHCFRAGLIVGAQNGRVTVPAVSRGIWP